MIKLGKKKDTVHIAGHDVPREVVDALQNPKVQKQISPGARKRAEHKLRSRFAAELKTFENDFGPVKGIKLHRNYETTDSYGMQVVEPVFFEIDQ